MFPIYPKIDFKISPEMRVGATRYKLVRIATRLRLQNEEGKYYFNDVFEESRFDLNNNTEEDFNEFVVNATKKFIYSVYLCQTYLIYSDKLISGHDGRVMIPLDESQISEKERLEHTIKGL